MSPLRASILALTLAAAALSQGCTPAAHRVQTADASEMPARLVHAVEAVALSTESGASGDAALCVTASGLVRSGGWSAGTLRLSTPRSAAGEVVELAFTATPPPPDAMVTQALTPITSRPFCWRDSPPTLVAIRVRAETNALERPVP